MYAHSHKHRYRIYMYMLRGYESIKQQLENALCKNAISNSC